MKYIDVEQKTLPLYKNYNKRVEKLDENTGKGDGKRGFPESGAQGYPFQDESLSEARRALQEFDLELDNVVQNLEGSEADKTRERDENYKRRREDTIAEEKNVVEHLDQTIGRRSPTYSRLNNRLQEAKKRLSSIELDVQRPLRVSLRWVYMPLLLLLALVEVPVNRLAFEFFFLETPVISLFIAIVLGLIIMFCAHFAGLWLRQASHYSNSAARVLHYVGISVIFVVIGTVVYFVAALRQGYVNLLEREATSNFGAMLQEGALGTFADEALKTDLGTAGFSLLAINVLIFLVGMVASFVRHDPHPDYERATRISEKTERRLHQIEVNFQKRVSKKNAEIEHRIAFLDRQLDQTESEIEEIKRELDATEKRRPEIVRLMSEVVAHRVLAYQRGNRSVRKGQDVPSCFTAPDIKTIEEKLSAQ